MPPDVFVLRRVICGHTRADAGDKSAGLFVGNVFGATEENVEPLHRSVGAIGFGESERTEEAGVAEKAAFVCGRAHDADDFAALAVETNEFADDVGRAAKLFLPERMGKNDDTMVAGNIVVRSEGAAEFGSKAEEFEIVWRNAQRILPFSRTAGLSEGDTGESRGRGGAFAVKSFFEIEIISRSERIAAGTIPGAFQFEELPGIFERERAEKQRVHETEHRDRSANADGERKNGNEGDGGSFEQRAEGEFQIVHCGACRAVK